MKGRIVGGGVSVYESPEFAAAQISRFPGDIEVQLTGEAGEFWEVDVYGRGKGYILQQDTDPVTHALCAGCPRCHASSAPGGIVCRMCGLIIVNSGTNLEVAGLWRRFFAHLLDLLLIVLTAIVGWCIWLYFTAKQSQTPGKAILDLYILDGDGAPARPATVWERDFLIELILWHIVGIVLGYLTYVAYAWAVADKNKQALHDKMANTLIAYAPAGLFPR